MFRSFYTIDYKLLKVFSRDFEYDAMMKYSLNTNVCYWEDYKADDKRHAIKIAREIGKRYRSK